MSTKRLACLLLASILLLVTVPAALGQTLAPDPLPAPEDITLPDLGGIEITVAVENAYPPYNFIDPATGEGAGWDYDTFRDICRLINCVPVFREVSWDGMLIAIANGEYDVAGDGITYTPERDESVDFGMLYQSYDETLLVRADEDRFSTVEELLQIPGFVVGTQIGTTNEITAVNLFGAENVRSYDPFGNAIQALLGGDVDAVAVDRPAAEGYIATTGGLRTIEESISGIQGLSFAYPPGSELVEPINTAMLYMMATGRWDQLYTRWFNQPTLPDLGGREVVIAVENSYPPYNFIDPETGEGAGWDYDTFREICRRLNCVPVFEEVAWDGMLLAIANGEYDVAGDGITYTPERDETVDFSQLYQSYDETLLVREDEDRFTNSQELMMLDGFVVGTQIGTTNEITARNIFGEDNVRSYDPFGNAIQALLNGDIDAVVVDRPAAEGYIATTGGLRTLAESLTGIQGLAFAYPPGSDL
ncbi:transporter substrate-binding domain-containing protein, partial [Anaerolineae bacterium CFX9]|nr:transporter substrate-binding domain-containing protein [Anaerolineae bacterium CFX9]